MTNTYLLNGPDDPDDIVAGTDRRRVRGPPRRRPGQHRHRRLRVRHDRGLPDRGRQDHRAAARGQPHRQRPRRCSARSTPWATTSRWARPAPAARTARASRWATACRRCGCRASPSAGPRPDGGRRRSAAQTCSSIGDRVVGPGPAAASRSRPSSVAARHTEVRVYEGEVESLSSAESQGVGVRVVVDHRQGFAYAGSLDARRAGRDPGRGPRQRHLRHARRVPRPGRARRRRRARPRPVPRPGWPTCPPRPRSTWPWSSSGRCRAADPRITGVEAAEYVDAMAEGCVVTTTGIRTSGRETACYVVDLLRGDRGRRHPDRLRLLGGPRARRPRHRGRRRPMPPGGPPGCWVRPSRRRAASPSCSTRTSPPSSSASSAARCRARRC